jgi:hypothetical protein
MTEPDFEDDEQTGDQQSEHQVRKPGRMDGPQQRGGIGDRA